MRLKTLSHDFISKLAELSAGALSPSDFEKLLNSFESEIKNHYFTHSSESNLLRILRARYDKIFFLSECLSYPHYIEILITISSNSNYLSDILIINPEYFYLLINSSYLTQKLDEKSFRKEVDERISGYESLDSKVHALNAFKRREILRTGLKDIYAKAEPEEITNELSIAARILTDKLFSSCYQFILKKYKIEKINRSYCIISLGKLGGNELNYSSDTDIIIFYDQESKIGNRYYSEILSETIQLFLEKSSSSESGSLYRIDLRLRPDGKNSLVCRSLREYLDYYESRGNDWERQMLIKAGYLGGSKKLFNEFIKYVDGFVYPTAHFVSPIGQIKKLKKIIERDTEEANIKLIPGGIRDIEFIVQALQLLNGGKINSLKTGNTFAAIKKLQIAKLLSDDETEVLESSYKLYRKVEHFLQLMNNKQTHIIPESGELAEKLSFYFGYKNPGEFINEINKRRKKVKAIYDLIVGSQESAPEEKEKILQTKFQNPQKAFNDISFLREGRGITVNRQFDRESIDAFSKIENDLFDYLIRSDDPDVCLANFVRVIKQAGFPSIWYNEFRDKNFFRIFLNLCENSQYTIDLFAEDKLLREKFLSRDFLNKLDEKETSKSRLKDILFKISVQLTMKLIKTESASEILSKTVTGKIKLLSEEFSKSQKWKNDFFIIVLGSTGTQTMTFASDVDLIFTVKNSGRYETVQKDFQSLLSILKKELTPFNVDCRLRPEGESSQLVWDLEKYKEYYNKRARFWELQSFIKAGFISGNKKLFDELVKSFLKRISVLSRNEIIKGITEIRSKSLSKFPQEMNLTDLKKNPGGLGDIEYIAHYFLLSGRTISKKLIGKSVPVLLKEVSKKKRLKKVLNELAGNYIFLKKLEIFNQLVSGTASSKISDEERRFEKLAGIMKIKDWQELKRKLYSILKVNRETFSEILLKK